MAEPEQSHKQHRPKFAKKSKQKGNFKDTGPESAGLKSYEKHKNSKNAKGFTFKSAVAASRAVHRGAERLEKKTHIPLVDRTPLEPPPIVVAILGPPKVGKTTLLQSLTRFYTHQKLSSPVGPVTIVSGKKRRLTFVECNNDINSMIDFAKVADLVLLLTDASYGFEMETFEFLHICQVHGMPRIMGVLTHLDMIKNVKAVKRTKKLLKHRFWTEVYQGAKLFYLSTVVNDQYLKNDVKNLARFISVMKFRPLLWRSSHPYVLCDRMEDITRPEIVHDDPKCDRNIVMYGYVRGAHLQNGSSVHIPGYGDSKLESVSFTHDPCPLPDKDKKRKLDQRERLLYAPFSGVSGILYDKDAVYIDLGGSHSHKSTKQEMQTNHKRNKLFEPLSQPEHQPLDAQLSTNKLRMFEDGNEEEEESEQEEEDEEESDDVSEDGTPGGSEDEEEEEVMSDEEEEEEEVMSDEEEDMEDESESGIESGPEADNVDGEEDMDSGKSDTGVVPWKRRSAKAPKRAVPEFDFMKTDVYDKAVDSYRNRKVRMQNWMKMVYEQGGNDRNTADQSDEDDEFGGLFKLSKKDFERKRTCKRMIEDSPLYQLPPGCSGEEWGTGGDRDWTSEGHLDSIRDCFASGRWAAAEDAEKVMAALNGEGEEKKEDSDDDVFGDFEDLEAETSGIKPETSLESPANPPDSTDPVSCSEPAPSKATPATRLEKKRKLKQMFDAEYDETTRFYRGVKEEMGQQSQLNKSIFEGLDDERRVVLEGFRPGMYVRMELAPVPVEFVDQFDAAFPYIVGGLLNNEQNIGHVQTRIMKHRWYPKILKNRDPLIISLGWRRFQTMPIYSSQDHNGRNRMLKYTPQHLHCHATFFGPITPQGTGLLAIQTCSNSVKNFRIAAMGVVLNLDKSIQVMKKLKLTGMPYKVFKKTAFVKDMFNSPVEVAKFEGAKLQCVSGIRGQVKKALREPPGAFRASFEDKILLRDLIFLRTWFAVEIPKFYSPVFSLLLPGEQKTGWEGMKTVGTLRFERQMKPPVNQDSVYKAIERRPFLPDPLVVPKKLEKELPYELKTKDISKMTTLPGPDDFEEGDDDEDTPLFGPHKRKSGSGSKDEDLSSHTAVILEPHESKVQKLMTMLKTVKTANQAKEATAHGERIQKHKKKIAALEAKQASKLKDIKRRICRSKSQQQTKKENALKRKSRKD